MSIRHRWMAWVIAAAMCSVVVACDDDPEDGIDGGGETDAGTGGEDAATGDAGNGEDAGSVDAGPVEPSIVAEDQDLGLSTVVTVAEVNADGPAWVVIREDDGGAPGEFIGMTLVESGAHADVEVALDRPAVSGETLHAMLHIDADPLGTFDDADTPVLVDDAPVSASFVATVTEGTPAVRLTVTAAGNTGYDFTGAEPARYADTIGEEDEDQTLTLRRGWRYELVNEVSAAHPFQFVRNTPGAAPDVVQLAEGGVAGMLEGDEDIDFTDEDSTLRFTVSTTFAAGIDTYRCELHPQMMRGTVDVIAP